MLISRTDRSSPKRRNGRLTSRRRRPGYVLIAVLIVLVVLSLLAYRFTDSMTTEYRGAVRTGDMAKLRAAAVSGVNYTAASLADPSIYTQIGGNAILGNPSIFNNQSFFADQVIYTDPNDPNKTILFSVVAVTPLQSSPASAGGTNQQQYQQQYGVIDEGSKLNINAWAAIDKTGNALYTALLQLPNMTANPQTAANIVAYVLPSTIAPLKNNAPTGAQSSYYDALANPYQAKNSPLNSLDELLMVQGVTPQLLYGNDQNQNGLADDSSSGQALDRGWQDFLTVNGRELNVNMNGTLRINVNGDSLTGINAALQASTLSQEMQTFIMGAKLYTVTPTPPASTNGGSSTNGGGKDGKGGGGGGPTTVQGTIADLSSQVQSKLQTTTSGGKQISNLLTLANSQVSFTQGTGKDAKTIIVQSPMTTATLSQYLPTLLDQCTTTAKVELNPRINVSTATQQVLSMLPGLTSSDVTSLASAQAGLVAGDPANSTGAWMVTKGGLSLGKFSAISQYVTGNSLLYRVQVVAYYQGSETNASSGMNAPNWPMARVEALIDTNLGYPRVVYIRDLTSLDNPRGFNLPLTGTQP